MADQPSNTKRDQFADLLRELFQLNQPELDFGIYRIMHARKDDINRFIEQDLPRIVGDAFKDFQGQDKVLLQAELDKARKAAEDAGFDPEQSPKVQELQGQLSGAVNLGREEGEVYDALITFFNRYYDEGDFISRRVYKDGTYAIPYNGEEVVLHWANKDQYYIKSSETLRDYSFRLNPDNEENPMRVHFRLVDAEAGAQNNNKEAEESKRVFVLDAEQPWEEVDGEQGKELHLRFHYRAATAADWTAAAKKGATAAAAKKPPTQDHLRQIAVERLLGEGSDLPAQWKEPLAQAYIKANGEPAEYSLLQGQLDRYTKKNTFDYFIHKDLGGFLTRELDFYIKNELLRWEDVAAMKSQPARLGPLLSKIEVIRIIGEKIIAFLAQLEEFQKKLWLKKKFVTEVNYCITLDRLEEHEELLEQIFENEAQREQWVDLYGLDLIDLDKCRKKQSLQDVFADPRYRYLMVDTGLLKEQLKADVVGVIDGLDDQINGVLVNSENSQALRLGNDKYSGLVKAIYIDPPYNTGGDEFLYRDSYQHSSWISMMQERVAIAREWLSEDGVIFVSSDDTEIADLRLLMNDVFGIANMEEIIAWRRRHNQPNDKSKMISKVAEFITVYGKDINYLKASGAFYGVPLSPERIEDYTDSDDDPNGPWTSNPWKAAEGRGGSRYKIITPTGKEFDEVWYGSESTFREYEKQGRIHWTSSGDGYPRIKIYLKEAQVSGQAAHNFWGHEQFGDNAAASRELAEILGFPVNKLRPKPTKLVKAISKVSSSSSDLVLDYFAGSGTTAHAVVDQNREEGASRKYFLVEMGKTFESVLRPRMQKIAYARDWANGRPKLTDGKGGSGALLSHLGGPQPERHLKVRWFLLPRAE